MDILSAQKKAERLSKEYQTIAVVFVKFDMPYLGQRVAHYDACLQENYEGNDEFIESMFSRGVLVSKEYI